MEVGFGCYQPDLTVNQSLMPMSVAILLDYRLFDGRAIVLLAD